MSEKFVNSYDITEEVYLSWARTPIGKLAKRNAKALLVLFISELVMCAAFIAIGIYRNEPIFLIVAAAAAGYFVLKRFVLDKNAQKRRFKLLKGRKGVPVWHRELEFGDESIRISDAGEDYFLEYSKLISVSEVDDWFCLWLDESSAYRVAKNGFTSGDPSKFVSWLTTTIKESKSKKKKTAKASEVSSDSIELTAADFAPASDDTATDATPSEPSDPTGDSTSDAE